MKILLQDPDTNTFYTPENRWTSDPEAALSFPDLPSAIDFVMAFRLHHLRPVLYLSRHQEIKLPVLDPA